MKTLLAVMAITLSCCTQPSPQRSTEHTGEDPGGRGGGGESAEHGEEPGHHEGGGEGEEGGVYIGALSRWDGVRGGIRLRLSYDEDRKAFHGTAENTTESKVCAVRVEVHLKGGSELGPTRARDLDSGESIGIVLTTAEQFEHWTAHPETSACPA